jgi:heme oxygenase
MQDCALLAAPGLQQLTLLELLRSTTKDVHERLHGHAGLAAVKDGTIARGDYVALLCRLYGFHRAFEIAMGGATQRTDWLKADLAEFGFDRDMCSALPYSRAFPRYVPPYYFLGAQYVVEGSALGGRSLARQLDALLGGGMIAGRSFFTGHGATTGIVWREYLTRLSAVPDDPSARAAVVEGATATFAMFERWLEGWDIGHAKDHR